MKNADQVKPELKLFMVLLGSKAPGRHVEQHDFFFGIAAGLKELVPEIKAFWHEAGEKIHIDGWREVTAVDGYSVKVAPKHPGENTPEGKKLFFINLGGYQENKFEEQHYAVLTVKNNRSEAFMEAKETLFYRHNHFEGANSHIDDRYGIDVDDLYEIEDILSPMQTQSYKIQLQASDGLTDDPIHLGYLQLGNL